MTLPRNNRKEKKKKVIEPSIQILIHYNHKFKERGSHIQCPITIIILAIKTPNNHTHTYKRSNQIKYNKKIYNLTSRNTQLTVTKFKPLCTYNYIKQPLLKIV